MKTLKRQLRRAFTIVELVVVIAVIAALAAILIPTFVNVMNNANQANDTSLVNYINTTLTAQEAKGNTPDKVDIDSDGETDLYNVTTALNIVADNGVDVTKLDTTASNADFVYNATTNSFLYYTDDFTTLYNGEEPASDDKLVIVASSFDSSRISTAAKANLTISNYCVYCTSGSVTLTDSSTTVTVWLYGTNNTTFTVNLPNGTAMDYCNGSTVKIEAIYNNSFHVYGKYAELSLTKGHLVLESGAKIGKLNILNDNAEKAETKLTYSTEEVTVEFYYAVSGFAEIYSNTDSTTTVSVDTFVSAFKISKENVGTLVVSEDGTVSADTSGLGTEDNPYLATADNIDTVLALGTNIYVELYESFEISSAIVIAEGSTVVLDLNGYSITADGCHAVDVYGTLTITDSSEEAGSIENITSGNKYTIYVHASSNVTVEKISIVRTCTTKTYYAVANIGGNFTIKSGSITSFDTIYSESTYAVTTIDGGTITGTSGNAVRLKSGTVNVNSGSVEGSEYGIYQTGGEVNVTDGSIYGTTYGVYVVQDTGSSAIVNINGGKVNGGTNGVRLNPGTLNIAGGEILSAGTGYGVYSYKSTDSIMVKGGTISGGIYLKGSFSMEDGNIYGGDIGINATASSSATIKVNGGTLYGIEYAIKTAGEVIVYGGTIGKATIDGVENISQYGIYSTTTSKSIIIADSETDSEIDDETDSGKSAKYIYATIYGIYTKYTTSISGNTTITVAGNLDNKAVYGVYMDTGSKLAVENSVSIIATNSSKNSGSSIGIVYFKNVTINIEGGTISGGTYGISGNGSYPGSNVTIKGGSISGGNVGYYHPENGTLVISGGSITGKYAGLQICAGTVTISGGTFTATATSDEISASTANVTNKTGDGVIHDGAAVSIIDRNGYGTYDADTGTASVTSVTITSGTFISASGVEAVQAYSFTKGTTTDDEGNTVANNTVAALDDEQTIVTITGGEFSSSLTGAYTAYCVDTANGYAVSDTVNEKGYYTVSKSEA